MPLNIKKIRKWVDDECDSNNSEAARRLEMQQSNFQRLLSGDRSDIRLSTLEHMAAVMRVEPADLIRQSIIV